MAIAGLTGLDFGSGGVSLKASAAVTADQNETAVFVGRGWFAVVVDVTALVVTADQLYNIHFQANTAAASGTWVDLAPAVVLAHTSVNGGQATSTTGKYIVGVFNPYDNQVRVQTHLNGTTPSVTFQADAFPLPIVAAF